MGTCGGTWCVRGPHDGTGDEAILILPHPPRVNLHPASPISTFVALFFWCDCFPSWGIREARGDQSAQMQVFNFPVLLRKLGQFVNFPVLLATTDSKLSPPSWRPFELE